MTMTHLIVYQGNTKVLDHLVVDLPPQTKGHYMEIKNASGYTRKEIVDVSNILPRADSADPICSVICWVDD